MTYNAKISGVEPVRNLLATVAGANMRLAIVDLPDYTAAAITLTPESAKTLGTWLVAWAEGKARESWIAKAYPEVAETQIAVETRHQLVVLLEDITAQGDLPPKPSTIRSWGTDAANILPHLKETEDPDPGYPDARESYGTGD